ncbi:MAG: heavy metal response regulator transcription factor [Holophaga sp.]|jgi:two-component system copper resistance phosphate regulon response regulator CusR
MKILIVEDEPKTAAYLTRGLSENGYTVQAAGNGETGLAAARSGAFDLVLLDVMLPGRSGWSVIEALRKEGFQTPVLFLTAKDTVPDRVKGLELGADDYLVKPFAFSELLARIRGLLRRNAMRPQEALAAGDLELDLVHSDARRGGRILGLTRQEFLLLSLFIRRRGEVLSRSLIAEEVWGMSFDSDTNVVDVAVRRLRRKVDDEFEHKLIHTERGLGYVFETR